MKLYTVILVSGPKDEGPYPAICYDHKTPICSQYKHIVEVHLNNLREGFPHAEFKLGEINVE